MKKAVDKDIVDWSKEAFPDLTMEAQLKKLDEEIGEWYDAIIGGSDDENEKETADVYIVGRILADRFDSNIGRYFLGMLLSRDIEWLERRVVEKMNINKSRQWKKENGVYKHKEKKNEN